MEDGYGTTKSLDNRYGNPCNGMLSVILDLIKKMEFLIIRRSYDSYIIHTICQIQMNKTMSDYVQKYPKAKGLEGSLKRQILQRF